MRTAKGRVRRWRAWLGGLLLGLLDWGSTPIQAASVETELRELDDFHAVAIHTGGTVTLGRGEPATIRIEAWPETLAALVTEVDDGVLVIRMESQPHPRGPIRMDIVYPTLDRLTLNGSADVTTDAVTANSFHAAIQGSADLRMPGLTAETAEISVSGSGDLEVAKLFADSVEVTVSGSGDVVLAGETDEQQVTVSGSGNVSNENLRTRDADARVSGSGNVRLAVSGALTATISGSGDIRYLGEPEVESRISGSGRIRRD